MLFLNNGDFPKYALPLRSWPQYSRVGGLIVVEVELARSARGGLRKEDITAEGWERVNLYRAQTEDPEVVEIVAVLLRFLS